MFFILPGIFFSFWIIACVAAGVVAADKGRNVLGWVLLGILFGPFTLLLVALLPKIDPQDIKSAAPNENAVNIRREFEALKAAVSSLTERLHNLESKINTLFSAEISQPSAICEKPKEPAPVEKPQVLPLIQEGVAPASYEKTDIEANIGKYWLNKIGIILFSLGIAFLITYTFRYFGAFVRIMSGYLVSAGLFFLGVKLEKKDKLANYGRVIYGGAWAIVYFTTYAMYHFQSSKIIYSRPLDLFFLAAVALGMLIHSLKYRSEVLSATALFVGYLTATMGEVGSSTFTSCVFLAMIALALVYKMQWVNFIFTGIILTYLTHFFWVSQHIYLPQFKTLMIGESIFAKKMYFQVSFGFLSIYWFLFACGIHLIRKKTEAEYNKLSAANFLNSFLFFFMVYPQLARLYPGSKFFFVFGLGLLYLILAYFSDRIKNNRLFTSDIITGLSLLTLAVPLKLMPFYTSLIWCLELPFLLALGLIFKQRAVRYFCFCLAVFLFLKMLAVDFTKDRYVSLFTLSLNWLDIISFTGFICLAGCFYLGRFFKKGELVIPKEKGLYNIFSALAAIYLTIFIWRAVNLRWLTLGLCAEVFAVFYLGILLSDKYLRAYALTLISIVFFRFCFVDDYAHWAAAAKWMVSFVELASVYAVYFLYHSRINKGVLGATAKVPSAIVFWLAALMLVVAIYRDIAYPWISLGLGAAGVLMFSLGFFLEDKIFRWAGFTVFALTIIRVVFVDLSELPVIYKITSFILIGILFLAISYLYTKKIDKVH